jgi:hypothetical protein
MADEMFSYFKDGGIKSFPLAWPNQAHKRVSWLQQEGCGIRIIIESLNF